MPTYDYECEKCGSVHEVMHGMSESPQVSCLECGTACHKKFSPNFGGFFFKGGTPSTHYREKQNKKKRSEEMTKRQKSKHGDLGPKITPNIAGVQTESWSDAQKMAKEAGMNSDSYTPWVEKEKKNKKSLMI
jgi:putative FmdB family regulatory protein